MRIKAGPSIATQRKGPENENKSWSEHSHRKKDQKIGIKAGPKLAESRSELLDRHSHKYFLRHKSKKYAKKKKKKVEP
jgi:hypothetical protein